MLLAGGIGVTPVLAMAAALAVGAAVPFHYAGRTRGELAFLGEIERARAATASPSTPTTRRPLF